QWVEGTELCQRSERMLRDHCTGVDWELANVDLFTFRTLYMRGEVRELSRRVPLAVRDAVERGNFFAETNFRAHMGYFVALAAGNVEAARVEAGQSLEHWSNQDFHLQHYFQRVG